MIKQKNEDKDYISKELLRHIYADECDDDVLWIYDDESVTAVEWILRLVIRGEYAALREIAEIVLSSMEKEVRFRRRLRDGWQQKVNETDVTLKGGKFRVQIVGTEMPTEGTEVVTGVTVKDGTLTVTTEKVYLQKAK